MTHINKKLNLVIPVYRDEKATLFVHSTPMSSESFQNYWMLAAQTMNALLTRDIGVMAPRFARQMLYAVALEQAGPLEEMKVAATQAADRFMSEIRRMTNVMVPAKHGWDLVPLDDALAAGLIDSDEAGEIDSAIVFFTAGSHAHRKTELPRLYGSLGLWGARTESLNCTDFRTSLLTLTASANSGGKTPLLATA